MTANPHYVLMDGVVWIAPAEHAEDSQCTARTKARRRCRNPIDYSQTTGWSWLPVPSGEAQGYDLTGWPSDFVDRWLAQRCARHWELRADAAVDPEWHRADEGRA